MNTDIFDQAHSGSSNSMVRLVQNPNQTCGCFHCSAIFSGVQCTINVAIAAATCPRCGMDTVLPEDFGFPLTEEFLLAMHARFFGASQKERPCDTTGFLSDWDAIARKDVHGILNAVARQGCAVCVNSHQCIRKSLGGQRNDVRCTFEVDVRLFRNALAAGLEVLTE